MVGTPLNEMGAEPFIYTVYPIYFVALMHFLDGEARAALARFRPLLQVNDVDYARIEFELTTVPNRHAWIATALALFPALLISLNSEVDGLSRPGYFVGLSYMVVFTFFSVASALILIHHTIRQLRFVSHILAAAPTLNLFQVGPAYAFSRLTARTGIGLLLFAYFNFLLNPPTPAAPLTIVHIFTSAIVVVAIAAFVLPLLGLHQRLVQEKSRLESEVNRSVETIHHELQERVASRNFAGTDDLNTTLSSLLSLRQVIAKLPTWPWQAETLRAFVSALLVPILIWVITRILEQIVPF
jgi:hypothetical protein